MSDYTEFEPQCIHYEASTGLYQPNQEAFFHPALVRIPRVERALALLQAIEMMDCADEILAIYDGNPDDDADMVYDELAFWLKHASDIERCGDDYDISIEEYENETRP